MVTHMKTTIEIPDPLLVAARQVAAREGISLRALVEEGLRRALDERQGRRKFRLRQVVFGGKGRRPEVKSWEQISALIYEGRGA